MTNQNFPFSYKCPSCNSSPAPTDHPNHFRCQCESTQLSKIIVIDPDGTERVTNHTLSSFVGPYFFGLFLFTGGDIDFNICSIGQSVTATKESWLAYCKECEEKWEEMNEQYGRDDMMSYPSIPERHSHALFNLVISGYTAGSLLRFDYVPDFIFKPLDKQIQTIETLITFK